VRSYYLGVTIRRGKRRYSFNRGEQSLPSDIHRMGSKIFADVDTLSVHGAARVSYIETSGLRARCARIIPL